MRIKHPLKGGDSCRRNIDGYPTLVPVRSRTDVDPGHVRSLRLGKRASFEVMNIAAPTQMKNMKKRRIGLLCVVATILAAIGASAQREGSVAGPKEVEQGSTITLQITIDKPSSIRGAIGIQVTPPDDGEPFPVSYSPLMDRTSTVTISIPLEGATGKWKVSKVLFHPGANSNSISDKELTPTGDLVFHVMPHKRLVLPTQANVEIK